MNTERDGRPKSCLEGRRKMSQSDETGEIDVWRSLVPKYSRTAPDM